MGMFDYYEPVPPLSWKGKELSGWQGKDGPCALLHWRQGQKTPIDQIADEECKLKTEKLNEFILPDGCLTIYTNDLEGKKLVFASIRVKNGIWVETELKGKNIEPFT